MSNTYNPKAIEKKWHKIWDEEKAFEVGTDYSNPKGQWRITIAGASSGSGSNASGGSYTVVRGDSLWKIAEKMYRNANLWPLIFMANRSQIKDPDLIYPGQKFTIPPVPKCPEVKETLPVKDTPPSEAAVPTEQAKKEPGADVSSAANPPADAASGKAAAGGEPAETLPIK